MNTIILRLPNRIPEVIHSSTNFNETLDYIENLSRDSLMLLNGNREFTKLENISKPGFYAVPEFRKITIYRKSVGWLYTKLTILKEFELIISKYQRPIDNQLIKEAEDRLVKYDHQASFKILMNSITAKNEK